MKYSKKVFIDMDGVLYDFVNGACKAHDREDPYKDLKNFGIFDMAEIWGMSVKDFWAPLSDSGFWVGLKLLQGAEQIIEDAVDFVGIDNVAILTAPSLSLYCVNEKRRAIKRDFPGLEKQIIFTGAKQFLAGPDHILVDDRNENIDDFNQHGGTGILVPRPWNRKFTHDLHQFSLYQQLCRVTDGGDTRGVSPQPPDAA
jgi:5'(3')-deoxyribonucleotidase